MSLYHKMKLLFRASAEAPMRQLVANNDIVIFEQEIADAERAIKTAKLHLVQIKTEIKLTEESVKSLQESIATREAQALEVLEKEPELAKELAGLIAEDEGHLRSQSTQLNHLNGLNTRITSDIKSAVRAIQCHRQKLSFLKANQHSLDANASLKDYSVGMHSCMTELNNSLQSINDRQLRARLSDESELEIEKDIGHAGIDERLKAAGVSTSEHGADQVLQRLIEKKTEAE